MIVHQSRLWRVTADGQTQALPFTFAGGHDIDHEGTTSPVASPDQNLVAFTQANDLWFMDLKSNQSVRLTHHGRPYSGDSASVYVLISAWSFDSKKILYFVTHSEAQDVEDADENITVPSAAYGYRIFDLTTKTSQPVKFPGEFLAWLPDDSFLLESVEIDSFDKHLLRYRIGEDLPQMVTPLKGGWGQTSISPDGRNVLLAFSDRIMKLNVKTGKLFDVSRSGFWSEYQIPSYSPSGKRIAYAQQDELDSNGFIRGKLIVDGKPVANFPGLPFEYHWIDDHVIALVEDTTVVAVDASTGKELGHSHFNNDVPALTASPR